MRAVSSLVFLAALPAMAAQFTFRVEGEQPGGWAAALNSLGLVATAKLEADVIVIPAGSKLAPEGFRGPVERGTIVILEGSSPVAESFGFHATEQQVQVQSIEDPRAPALSIVWEHAESIPKFTLPANARVFMSERWQHTPLIAGFPQGKGAVLWLATSPGARGYDRFPYLPQALTDLGFQAPFRSQQLWAFFDSSYRTRVDLEYFAPKWRAAGIAALHVAAWHYWERDAQADAFLAKLIEVCHRNGIQIYAWFELPHVSEKFWDDHPEWREKTALMQDAKLDWRKLMNLTNRKAFAAVSAGMQDLIGQFDWDGVNLAELYFESLEGHDNPARFTPLNDDVRREFLAFNGFDPIELFDISSPKSIAKTAQPIAQFLEFRAELARRQQTEWIGEIEKARQKKPWLDLVLTHVDDKLDTTMREKIGADTSRTLPLLEQHDFTFLVEDPATIWDLGPQRYPQIAARYRGMPKPERLAIDINIVERYQDVYPTKQQTGLELFELVHTAAAAFPRVTLYFESSIAKVDLPLLAASAATVQRAEFNSGKLVVDSPKPVGVAWTGGATVDGKLWPAAKYDSSATWLWLPSGAHAIQASAERAPLYLTDLNGDLKSATTFESTDRAGVEFSYSANARALATFDQVPDRVDIDGVETKVQRLGKTILLPRGQHLVTATRRAPAPSEGKPSETAQAPPKYANRATNNTAKR